MVEIGIVCGMASEARALGPLAGKPNVTVAISGARPDKAESEARRLVASGCRVLVSCGVAGGLDPTLAPGALLTPGEVIDRDGLRYRLRPDLIGAESNMTILGLNEMVMSVRAKAALAETGALAVDMETHRVAKVGVEAGLPVVAIRAVADPAGRALPRLANGAIGADGLPRIRAVLLGLLARPRELPLLLRAKGDLDRALTSLSGEGIRRLAAL